MQAKALRLAVARVEGSRSVLRSLAAHTQSPPCTITVRPSRLTLLSPDATVEGFNAAVKAHLSVALPPCHPATLLPCHPATLQVKAHLVSDLSIALGVCESRLRLDSQGTDDPVDTLGHVTSFELKARGGACDARITILHEDLSLACDPSLLPDVLLSSLVNALPISECPLRQLSRM